ncbi:unnamed protein product [Orchesella dallaii]
MPLVTPNSNDQPLNRQVMEIQEPDPMLKLEPEPKHDSESNVDEEDHRGGDASKGESEDEDDLLLAPMTANQVICILCGTRAASPFNLRRHTIKHHPERDAKFVEFLIETAVEIFPGIYAKYQAEASNPTTSKINFVCGGGDDSNDGNQDENAVFPSDDLLLAAWTADKLECQLCTTRVPSTEILRRHTAKYHPEFDAEFVEFLIKTAVEMYPSLYAEHQTKTLKVNSKSFDG